MPYPIDVAMSGAVSLGPNVVCDGFLLACKARVQTHMHLDHMASFETSKGFQDILLSGATYQLLCLERNADLPYRSNLRVLPEGRSYAVGESVVTVQSSGHMLGAIQVQVELQDGRRVGYSGDFQWPLYKVIAVDALVLDGTYGSPASVREYSQGEAETRFLELVHGSLARGAIHIFAHRGTLHRALQILTGNVDAPFVASRPLCREVDLYRSFGYAVQRLLPADSPEGTEARRAGRFIWFYGTGDPRPVDIGDGVTMSLSAYLARPDDPVIQYSERAYGVALSNHADFNGTLEYVKATGAQFVVTDNSRGGKGYELALEIKSRLGIEARPSSNFETREWGRGPLNSYR
jgi:putative mRNA 3-end processing factor